MPLKLPSVSILVLNYNGKRYLKDCFKSLKQLNYPKNRLEVIMGDNASSDDSVEYVKKEFPWVKVLRFDKNFGFPEGNNKCPKYAKGEYICFLNNDTKVDRDWLIELIKGFDYDKEIAICGSKLLLYDRQDIVNSAGGWITAIGNGVPMGLEEKDQGFSEPKFVGYVSGASMLIKKKSFFRLGQFDPKFTYCEDVDICWRAWLYGHKVFYVPTSIVYHKYRGSFGTTPQIRIYNTQRNRVANILKNFEAEGVIKGGIISLAYDVFRVLLCIKEGNFAPIRCFIKAYYTLLYDLPGIITERKVIQSKRKKSDGELKKQAIFLSLPQSIKLYVYSYHSLDLT